MWIFLLPWQTRYFYQAQLATGSWEAGSLSIYISEIILIILLFLRFLLWSKEKNRFSFNFKKNFFSATTFLVLFVGYAFISSWWSVFPELSVYYGLKLLLALGVFWLIRNKQLSLLRILTVLVAAAALQGALATWQFLNQFIPASSWLGIAEQHPQELGVSVVDTGLRRWLRGYGSFPHPNILGGFLTLGLIGALYIFEQSELAWQKIKTKKIQIYQISILGCLVMITSGLVLSFSRTAWLTSLLIILFIVVLGFTKNKLISFKTLAIVLVCMSAVVIMWVSVYNEPFVTRVTGNGYLETMSVNQRLDSLSDSWQMFKKHPVLGVGIGAYTYALHETFPQRTVWQLQPPHNTYALIAVELGGLGFLFFVLLIFYLLFIIWKNKLLFLLLFSLLFLGLFDYWWLSLSIGLYLTMFICGLSNTLDKE